MAIFVPSTDNLIVAVMKTVLNQAPGTNYMSQFQDYVAENSIEAYASALCNYADPTANNAAFAADIVANLGITAPAETVTAATNNVAALLTSYGANRGGAILFLVDIMNNLQGDAVWGTIATAFFNDVQAGITYSTTAGNTNIFDFTTGTPGTLGTDYILTAAADTVPGTSGADSIIATDTTLSSADRITGGNGTDELKVSSQNAKNFSAFEMGGVENVTATADEGNPLVFDMSGADENSVRVFTSLNSTGNVTYNEITTDGSNTTLHIENSTDGADFTAEFQDDNVDGTADVVALNLIDNNFANNLLGNTTTITVGRESDNNGGIETINAYVTGATTVVQQLDSDISTLGVTGDANLTIVTNLNGTVDVVDAADFTGNLNISMTNNRAAGNTGDLTVDTGSGNDTVNLDTVDRDAVVTMGAGNDTLTMGVADDNVSMGAGNDQINIYTEELTVSDVINGGEGADTLTFNVATSDTVTHSETEQVDSVETWNMGAGGSVLELAQNMIDTLSTGSTALTVNMTLAGNTVDMTYISFDTTDQVRINGTTGIDTVIADDATVNAKAVIALGTDAGDILKVIGETTTTLRQDDFANITGVDTLELTTATNIAQTFTIDLVDATEIDTIKCDRNLPQGTELWLTSVAGAAVTVQANSNVTVYVDGTVLSVGAAARGGFTVVDSLEYTENTDNMTGTAGDDVFSADSLDQVDAADQANGLAHVVGDTLRLDFTVGNPLTTLNQDFNNTGIANIEILTFNTDRVVSFNDTAGAYTFTTVNLGTNHDVVVGSGVVARTYNGKTGNDNITAGALGDTLNGDEGNDTLAGAAGSDIVNGGVGDDILSDGAGAAADTMNGGDGNDTITSAGGADTVTGGAGNDVITMGGAAAADTITGGTGADSITLDAAGVADLLLFAIGDTPSGNAAGVTWLKTDAVSWDNVTNFTATKDVMNFNGTTVVTIAGAAAATNGIDVADGANRIGSHLIDANGFVTFYTDDAGLTVQNINSASDMQLAFEYLYKNHTQNEALFFLEDRDANGTDTTMVVVNNADGSQSAVELIGVTASASFAGSIA